MRQRTGDSAALSGRRDAAFGVHPCDTCTRSGPAGTPRTRARCSPGLSGISDST